VSATAKRENLEKKKWGKAAGTGNRSVETWWESHFWGNRFREKEVKKQTNSFKKKLEKIGTRGGKSVRKKQRTKKQRRRLTQTSV